MSTDDPLPRLVRGFLRQPGGPEDRPLLEEFTRHVGRVAAPYPDAYFALGRKSPEAIADLTNRAFTSCARIPKGRHPFAGRVPFQAYVDEDFEGRTIRYHSFYARLSIAREMLRDDYARNLHRDPVLHWRADLFRQIGAVLRDHADPVDGHRGPHTRWRLPEQGIALSRSPEQIVEALRACLPCSVELLVLKALELGGPTTRARLTVLVETTLGTPAPPAPDPVGAPDPDLRLAVRAAVMRAWSELAPEERQLLLSLARGATYDELIAANPEFQHRVALTRAVSRLGQRFAARLEAAVEGRVDPQDPPRELIERVMEVVLEVGPELDETLDGGGE
jgi:hypothetical protein